MKWMLFVVVFAAGCKQTVDKDVAEKLVKKVLEREQIKPSEVSCPDGQPIAEGTTFDCTAYATGHIDVVVHVKEESHPADDLFASGAGGDYKLVGELDKSIVSRRRVQRALPPNSDAIKCPEAQKLKKVGDFASCEVTIDGQKHKANSVLGDNGATITVQ